jgi:hypothetical protein
VLGAFWGSGAGVVTLAATGLTSGLIQGDVREGLNLASGNNFNGSSIAQDAILGGTLNVGGGIALRYIGLPAIEGLNEGRGSYDSIFKQIFTNIDSGAVSNVSPARMRRWEPPTLTVAYIQWALRLSSRRDNRQLRVTIHH